MRTLLEKHVIGTWHAATLIFLMSVLSLSLHAHSANPSDVDADDDGLIEIDSFAELNLIRYNLFGTGLTDEYGVTNSNGCPAGGCNGYELSQDLNFDTNQNQRIDDEILWNNGAGWLPIGTSNEPFMARFHGNGFTIRNLYIDRPTSDYVGLFGFIEGTDIRDVQLDGFWHRVSGQNYVGSLAGAALNNYFGNTLHLGNVASTGFIEGHSHVGGLVGNLVTEFEMTIEDCQTRGSVKGTSMVGGIAGSVDVLYFEGPIFSNNHINIKMLVDTESGGIAGNVLLGSESEIIITNNHVEVLQRGTHELGGVIGSLYSDGPFSLASISRNRVDATNLGSGDNIGGLLGYATVNWDSNINLDENFVTGANAGRAYIGGMIGYADNDDSGVLTIWNSYTNASARGQSIVGGLIGYAYTSCYDQFIYSAIDIVRSYATGRVQGNAVTGGLIGEFHNDGCAPEDGLYIAESYWDLDTTGQNSSSAGGEGYTTGELQCPTEPGDSTCATPLYPNWDTTIWDFGTSSDYPKLRL